MRLKSVNDGRVSNEPNYYKIYFKNSCLKSASNSHDFLAIKTQNFD